MLLQEEAESEAMGLEPGVLSWCWLTSTLIPAQLTLIRLWLMLAAPGPPPSEPEPPLFPQPSESFLSSPPFPSAGSSPGEQAEALELGLPVLGVNGWQVALGTRNPDFSPAATPALGPPEQPPAPGSFFSAPGLEYGLKLDLSSTPMSLSFKGPDLESLSPPEPLEVTEESLEEGDGSGFPICEQVCAKRARGLFFASSCGNQKEKQRKMFNRGLRKPPIAHTHTHGTLVP